MPRSPLFPDAASLTTAKCNVGNRGLGIIAGGGELPARVAAAGRAVGRSVFILGLEGFADPAVLAPWPHQIVRLGAAGRILALLRDNGCEDIVMIGPVRRPSLLNLRPDAEGARILARVGRAAFMGDDGLLAAVIKVLAEEGFRVIGAQEVMREATAPRGVLTQAGPDAQAMADIARAVEVVRLLGAADVGQGCVVQQGLVLAVEAIEGTDAMLARCAPLRRDGIGGVLVKLVKPGQDKRADLPTIGPRTIRNVAAAGLRGLAFEAGTTILAEREACVAAADAAGLFLLGLDPETLTLSGVPVTSLPSARLQPEGEPP
ncbi:LpxI family protein [Rhodopila sp.]|uniref:LpxI family protein n=1 Tax=Rhodopila sp. TaxID=2480087 RepID=UPI003D0F1DAF